MRTVTRSLTALLLALAVACPAGAGDPPKEPAADDAFFILLKTAGRTWMLKRVPKPGQEGNDTTITYMYYEVLNVFPDGAELAQADVDQPSADPVDPLVVKTPFAKDALIFREPIGFMKGKIETVKTAAGSFECIKYSNPEGNTIWRSTKFPGLIVKQDDRFGTRELLKFDLLPGDPGAEEPKAKKEKRPKKGEKAGEEPAADDKQRLYRKKGRKWILRTVTYVGEKRDKRISVQMVEVVAVKDDQCELEITPLSQMKEKMKGVPGEKKVLKFDDTFEENILPPNRPRVERTERRKCEGGLYTCTVYAYRDNDSRDAWEWQAQEWPGLPVRRVVKGDKYESTSELIEFAE